MNPNSHRISLVTGATSGVGRGIASGLAVEGYRVVLVSRNPEKGQRVREEIIRETGNSGIELLVCDLSNQSSIKGAAKEFQERFDTLHLLSNNAGGLFVQREETVDGIEKTLAVDFLSHFLLTRLLMDSLSQGRPSRILTVAGGPLLLRFASIYRNDPQLKNRYSGFKAALQAALMRVAWTHTLGDVLRGTGVSAFSFHPGFIRNSLGRNLPWILRFPMTLVNPFFKKISATGMFLATSRNNELKSGGYYARKKKRRILPPDVMDDMGSEVWELGEKLCRLS